MTKRQNTDDPQTKQKRSEHKKETKRQNTVMYPQSKKNKKRSEFHD